jgi:DMSO/TMAO reductase YedYZ molybdopterin-dependent catalytic subunit
MKASWANIALLLILITLIFTGYLGLVNGHENRAWRLWLHSLAAYALIVLFFWKSTIILDAFRRKNRWTRERITFSVMLILLLLTVIMGLLWTFSGPIYLGGFSLVSLHIYVAVLVMLILIWHVRRMKFIFRVKGSLDRRLFLGSTFSALVGLLLWQSVEKGKALTGLAGAGRRFTGSYEQGSFTGNFPSVSWILDNPGVIDITKWQLAIDGAVNQVLQLSYTDILALPSVERDILLDCTSGWYTTQTWQGVLLKELLALAGLQESGQSVTVEAVSTYRRRFALTGIDGMLLAYKVANTPLSHGHGAPLRLVVANGRGYEWVKWVTHIRVNSTRAVWQTPLPLR